MVNVIRDELRTLVLSILDESLEREVNKILIELHSNLGEVKDYEFSTVVDAIEFLNSTEASKSRRVMHPIGRK